MAGSMKAGISLATFGFINLVLFITLSTPVGQIFTMLETEGESQGVNADVTPLIEIFRTVFGMMFVLSMVGLVIWAFLGAHEQEYEEY